MALITRTSMLDGKNYQLEIKGVTQAEVDAWLAQDRETRPFVHDQFSQLSAPEREFILNGITPEKWNEELGSEEEDDDTALEDMAREEYEEEQFSESLAEEFDEDPTVPEDEPPLTKEEIDEIQRFEDSLKRLEE